MALASRAVGAEEKMASRAGRHLLERHTFPERDGDSSGTYQLSKCR